MRVSSYRYACSLRKTACITIVISNREPVRCDTTKSMNQSKVVP